MKYVFPNIYLLSLPTLDYLWIIFTYFLIRETYLLSTYYVPGVLYLFITFCTQKHYLLHLESVFLGPWCIFIFGFKFLKIPLCSEKIKKFNIIYPIYYIQYVAKLKTKDTVLPKSALTSDTSCKFRGPLNRSYLWTVGFKFKGFHYRQRFASRTHRTQESTVRNNFSFIIEKNTNQIIISQLLVFWVLYIF